MKEGIEQRIGFAREGLEAVQAAEDLANATTPTETYPGSIAPPPRDWQDMRVTKILRSVMAETTMHPTARRVVEAILDPGDGDPSGDPPRRSGIPILSLIPVGETTEMDLEDVAAEIRDIVADTLGDLATRLTIGEDEDGGFHVVETETKTLRFRIE